MTHQYAHPSHVEIAETAGPHRTREQILAEQAARERRRQRAAEARTRVRRTPHAQP